MLLVACEGLSWHALGPRWSHRHSGSIWFLTVGLASRPTCAPFPCLSLTWTWGLEQGWKMLGSGSIISACAATDHTCLRCFCRAFLEACCCLACWAISAACSSSAIRASAALEAASAAAASHADAACLAAEGCLLCEAAEAVVVLSAGCLALPLVACRALGHLHGMMWPAEFSDSSAESSYIKPCYEGGQKLAAACRPHDHESEFVHAWKHFWMVSMARQHHEVQGLAAMQLICRVCAAHAELRHGLSAKSEMLAA